jgi:hypothetical protein
MTPENNDEISALKNQLFILLVALIVVSGTLTVYLYRQESLANKDINELQRLPARTNTNTVVLQNFVERLMAYGDKHPDYQAVLKKDGFTRTAPTPVAAPRK